jgi:peptidyl-prolyl cis-trans isomerase A (cyclophilin A)
MRRFASTFILAAAASAWAAEPPAAKAAAPAEKASKAEAPKAASEKTPKAELKWMERAAQGQEIYATLKTTMGDIELRLFTKDAPKTVENFVGLAAGEKEWTDPRTGSKTTRPLYDGTEFHRVIPEFMIQGGDPLGTGTGNPGYKFEDELQSGRKFDKPCLLAMANSGPNTNGSQFFLTEVPTHWLNGRHTIFGEAVKGCELVGKIARSREGVGGALPPRVKIERVVLSTKP